MNIKRYFCILLLLFTNFVIVNSLEPKISVIIPVYKVEKYLPECIDSIIKQDLEDIEIICINDGSPDNCLEILNKYKEKDSRITVIDQENLGVSAARNRGIEIAKGEYITFVDPDDWIDIDTYKLAYERAIKDNVDILSFGLSDNRNDIGCYNSVKETLYLNDSFDALFWNWHCINCWNKLYKKELVINSGVRFIENVNFSEDQCFNFMMFPLAKSIKILDKGFYHYRQRKDSAVHTFKYENRVLNELKIFNIVLKHYKDLNCLQGIEDKVLSVFSEWMQKVHSVLDETQRKIYCKQFLWTMGSDIYNTDVTSKLSSSSLRDLKAIESYAESPMQILENGEYFIFNQLKHNTVLTVHNSQIADCINIELSTFNNSDSQKFILNYVGGGYYTIQAKNSWKMIDVYHAKKKSGTNVWQYYYNDTDAQKWLIKSEGEGTYSLVSKCNSLYMTAQEIESTNNINICVCDKNMGDSQKFKFVKVY